MALVLALDILERHGCRRGCFGRCSIGRRDTIVCAGWVRYRQIIKTIVYLFVFFLDLCVNAVDANPLGFEIVLDEIARGDVRCRIGYTQFALFNFGTIQRLWLWCFRRCFTIAGPSYNRLKGVVNAVVNYSVVPASPASPALGGTVTAPGTRIRTCDK